MSNFIFSRRALQRMIGDLAVVLERDQLTSIVERLNRPGDARLPAMWELVMLAAFSTIGKLRHEIELPNGRRPDIELTASADGGAPVLIIGDVATISDAGLDEQNPVGVLSTELSRLAMKAGLNANHFGYDIRGGHVGPFRDGRMKLFLPKKGPLLELMREEVEPWICAVKDDPDQPRQFEYHQDEVAFSLTYNPMQPYARGCYANYAVAASRDKNPLFRGLKSKVAQLKQAPQNALRLLIACDGDSELLRQSKQMRSPGVFGSREVAEDFLRQNSSIDAVLLVTIDEQRLACGMATTYRMRYDLAIAPPPARSQRMTSDAISALDSLLREAVKRIPQPVQSAYNAALRCSEPGYGPDMIGGYEMGGEYVRLSSRALQRLLAGDLTVKDFIEAHGWNDGHGPKNPFARMAHAGRMIQEVKVDDAGDEDDDWLTFRFGMPDPAVAPFTVPGTAEQTDPKR